jgi:DnaJ homolog subfamily B member 12
MFLNFLPFLLLIAFSVLSSFPNIFGPTPIPDPHFSFIQTQRYDMARKTDGLGVRYHVNSGEFQTHPGIAAELAAANAGTAARPRNGAISQFEATVERVYTQELYSRCQSGMTRKQRLKEQEMGFLGWWTDWDKVNAIDAEVVESCEELIRMGLLKR